MIKIIKENGEVFCSVKEVLKAAGKDKIKPVFHHAYLCDDEQKEGQKIFACTDSRILFIFNDSNGFFQEYKNGLYEIIKNDKKEVILNYLEEQNYDFPNIFQVLPEKDRVIDMGVFQGRKELKTAKFYNIFYKNFPDCNIAVDQKFLDLVFNDDDISVSFNKSEIEKNSGYCMPVYFYQKDVIKIVMPVQTF